MSKMRLGWYAGVGLRFTLSQSSADARPRSRQPSRAPSSCPPSTSAQTFTRPWYISPRATFACWYAPYPRLPSTPKLTASALKGSSKLLPLAIQQLHLRLNAAMLRHSASRRGRATHRTRLVRHHRNMPGHDYISRRDRSLVSRHVHRTRHGKGLGVDRRRPG